MKRIVLFVEGEADAGAVPILIKRLLTDLHAWDAVFRFADGQPVVCLDPRFWEL